ncbi:stage II sporulation protein E (SpoIIE) [Oxobacter pfennigii]|uniref:Stage II sporulation protein E (SpoIIE) n=1 Tax=Oxobacter pfennigii TaxID=36849 RepID=A0A0P8X5E3_9CLOT|nr:SpoIIE family protein phosphatase [Oxobacter pfennigii]KPU46011.1 stage II sporulation protein E (SpoIIE) [Oxobacter pfennigii]
MKFFEDFVGQAKKMGKLVCGDVFLRERTLDITEFVLCDGIGSGVYANIAAISCASRIIELFKAGITLRSVCEMVADSMHRARKEDIPFSAFSAVRILHDGQFTVFTYEAPEPILIRDGTASILKQHFHTASYEVIGECSGMLSVGDSLVICSDGVTQAGLSHGLDLGIGSSGLVDFINHCLSRGCALKELPERILKMTSLVSSGRYEDDTTVAILNCRESQQITVLSGPPIIKSKDRDFIDEFMTYPGTRVVCGSTTAEILSRELKRDIKLKNAGTSFGSPPEYFMEGIDMITEGVVILNQINNILDENPGAFSYDSPVERLCSLMLKADVVTFMVGRAMNYAHSDLIFKQLGIRPRETTIRLIAEKLKEKGKLVVNKFY